MEVVKLEFHNLFFFNEVDEMSKNIAIVIKLFMTLKLSDNL